MMKKKLILFLLFIVCIGNTNAQLGYDTSYKRTYYHQKVTQFKLQKDNITGEYIFMGDSITDIAEWAELFGSTKVLNRGISADITFGLLNRLEEITTRKPAKLFVMIGINDIARNIPDTVIIANYKRMIERVKQESPSTKIYIQSILPTNNSFTEFKNHQNKEIHIQYINQQLQNIAVEYKVTYIDVASVLMDNEKKLSSRYTNDGLHLTGEGYVVWKKLLEEKKYCCK